jgi:hypothetical protein
MEYYEGRWCITMHELVEGGVMSEANYKRMARENRLKIARPGKGPGNYALVTVESLPDRFKERVYRAYPQGDRQMLDSWVRSNYELDQGAVVFFNDLERTGVGLSEERKHEYIVNASVLNCCIKLHDNGVLINKLMGRGYDWEMMAATIESLRRQVGHTLPTSTLRFRKKVAEYRREGYGCLISGKFGNQSARKVNLKAEQLILSIAVLPNRPTVPQVVELYNQFVCGELDIYDPQTGELFQPKDFETAEGEPLVLSESTVTNYLTKPKNRVLIEQRLNTFTTFMHESMPHMHRHAPEFSLSKVTFDDRDLPRKLRDTKARPKAYYAYDVASQCCIGYAYNRKKNVDLVVEMFRNMFRLIDRMGWGCPAEVEVENHLMSQWRESFLKAGTMFPFVHFCAPMNSQEKTAEAFNGAKKRSVEHRNHVGVGRFYAKKSRYRTESQKVFDEENDRYEDYEYYSWEQLIAEDIEDIRQYNMALHTNQKKYPGMTRWDVLVANLNPALQPLNKAIMAKYIGDHVETSVRRNSYCRVEYTDWWLSSTKVLERLAPNNYKVDAYLLRSDTGEVEEVYIYQNDQLVDRLQNVGTYNTAAAEATERDREVFVEQRKKVSEFTGYVSEHAIQRVGIAEKPRVPLPSEPPGLTHEGERRALMVEVTTTEERDAAELEEWLMPTPANTGARALDSI